MDVDKEIYLIRHGQSASNANPSSIITDPSLTELGRQQASTINLNVDLIICSSMRRALETLYYSKITGREILITDMCREKICGMADFKLFELREPELDQDFNSRMSELARGLLNTNYKKIGVVCHGCVIAALTGSYLNNAEMIKADLITIEMIANGRVIPIICCNSNW